MNINDLQERLARLHDEQKQLQQQLVTLGANINAYNGAIQECQYWIEMINNRTPETSSDVDTGDNISFS